MIWAFSILTIKKSIENMIKYNNKNIGNIFIGNKQIGKVYNGSKLVWQHQTTPDYPVYADDEIHYKSVDNNVIDVSISGLISNQYVPELDHNVIKFTGTLTNLPNGFMQSNTDLLEFIHMPYTVTSIGNNCFDGCQKMYLMNMAPFENVEEIGNRFCALCYGFTSISFKNLKNIKRIGSDFLFDCTGLISVDLSSFTEITEIKDNFIRGCSSLLHIDLTPMSKVETIGGYFLTYNGALKTVDMSTFTSLKKVGNSFLYAVGKNYDMVKINFPNLTEVGQSFLGSTHHETLDFSSLVSLEKVGTMWTRPTVRNLIINMDKVFTLLSNINPSMYSDSKIYVPDHLVEDYKEQVPNFASYYRPLSEYTE